MAYLENDNYVSLLRDVVLKTLFAFVDKAVEVGNKLIPEELVDELIFLLDELRRKLAKATSIEDLDELVYRSDARVTALQDLKAVLSEEDSEAQAVLDSKIDASVAMLEMAKPIRAKAKERVRDAFSRPRQGVESLVEKPVRKEDIAPSAFLFPEIREGKRVSVDTDRVRSVLRRTSTEGLQLLGVGRRVVDESRVRIDETLVTLKEMRGNVKAKTQRTIDARIEAYESILKQIER